MMRQAIGIDLGTTRAIAAVWDEVPRVLLNRESQDFTPSAVGTYKKQICVGQLALDRMLLAPHDTILSVRRLMGKGFHDPTVEEVRKRHGYGIVEPTDGTDDDLRVVMDGRQYSPIEISAMILKKVKEDAELRLNDEVESAVITVPAYFTEKQKDATRKAGLLAGLKVQSIVDEPTAAVLAFGFAERGSDAARNLLVYDLGGSTLDISVVTAVGGAFALLAIEGDAWLGGDDFDYRIMEHVLQHIQSVCGMDARQRPEFMVKLKERAEQAKKALSCMDRAGICIPGALTDVDGRVIDVEVELSRSAFEQMIAAEVARSVELVRQAIENAALTPEQIDDVLLVGGSTLVPLVRRSLAELFGEPKLMTNVDPFRSVAYGAALLAARSTAMPAITGMPYGIRAKGDKFEVIIPKGTTFPTPESLTRRFRTPAPGLRRIGLPIYAGHDPVASRNELQATLWLELPENLPAGTPIEIGFSLDEDGILGPVRVSFIDGSGTSIGNYLGRGGASRDRWEYQVDRLLRMKHSLRSQLTAETEQRWEGLYARAIHALNGNDIQAVEDCAAEMETLLQDVRRSRG